MPAMIRQHAYTLREMLVVIFLICVLLALLLPAIQAVRVRERRTQCNNNLKNLALGLQNYHDSYRVLPPGAMHAGDASAEMVGSDAASGPSWYFGILPFMGSRNAYDQILSTQRAGAAPHEFRAQDFADTLPVLARMIPDYMRCPNSPLPRTEKANGPIALSIYVGISGGCDMDSNSADYRSLVSDVPQILVDLPGALYHNTRKGTTAAAGGIVTASGLLPPGEHVSFAMCSDGLAHTMVVAEQSDWLRDRNPAIDSRYHGDAGWTVGGTARGGGWLSGTRRVGPVPPVAAPGGPPAAWDADYWNITTVRYPPNWKRVLGANPLPGCSENHGINNPLQSPHPGGLLIGLGDASVQFINEGISLRVLLQLAIRDDNQGPVSLP